MKWNSFKEFVQYKDRQIDTSRVNGVYDKAEIAIALAIQWDQQFNKGKLFERVNAVTELGGNKYGLFASALGKPDKRMIISGGEMAASPFPSSRSLDKYPQLNQPQFTKGFPIQINVRQILADSSDDIEAVKKIGGVAVHEATHVSDYSSQESKPNPSLGEEIPEQNRIKFESWFDANKRMILNKYPKILSSNKGK